MYNFAKNDGLCIIKFNLAQQLVQVKRAKKHEGESDRAKPRQTKLKKPSLSFLNDGLDRISQQQLESSN